MWAVSNDPFPKLNPRKFYGSMNITLRVTADGEPMQDIIIGAFCGDQIRGKNVTADLAHPGIVYLTVYGNKTGDKLSFKVCRGSDEHIFEIDNGLVYTFNGILGSLDSPYELDLTTGCVSVTQKNGSDYEVTIDGDVLEDNKITKSFTAKKITYKRTFTTAYATICLPFDVSSVDAAAAGRFYRFSGINDKYEVVMTEVTTGLTANTPYIVKPASTSNEVSFSYSGNVSFPLAGTPETKDGSSASAWSFKGTWTEKSFQGTPSGTAIYFFAAAQQGSVSPGDFVKVSTESVNTKALPFRAYLEYHGSGSLSMSQNAPGRDTSNIGTLPQSMKVIIAGNDGSITEIGTISIVNDDFWYNLEGRKLEGKPTSDGIYINNGRKVIIKDIY